MSSTIRSRSVLILSSVMGTSCLMIEKVPIDRQAIEFAKCARRFGQITAPTTGAIAAEQLGPWPFSQSDIDECYCNCLPLVAGHSLRPCKQPVALVMRQGCRVKAHQRSRCERLGAQGQ